MVGFSESVVEDAALAWLGALGYQVLHGSAIAVGEPWPECADRMQLNEQRFRCGESPRDFRERFRLAGTERFNQPTLNLAIRRSRKPAVSHPDVVQPRPR
jgi:hypothetical protein